jgi:integration host factor subunit alpha
MDKLFSFCEVAFVHSSLTTFNNLENLMAVTKADIVQSIMDQNGFAKVKLFEITETLLEIIKRNFSSGEDVLVSGFGKFCVNEKAERRGRNPATGESMMLEPRRVVTFRCSGKPKKKINK